MRVPFLYRLKSLQQFSAGLAFGAVFGWLLFLLFFGLMHEQHVDTIREQQAEIEELNEKIALFQKDIEEINEQNEKQLLIHEVKLEFQNLDSIKLNEMEVYELEKQALHYLNQLLLNKHVDTVSKNKELLISSLENKQFTLEKNEYFFKVRQLYLYTTVELFLDIHLSS